MRPRLTGFGVIPRAFHDEKESMSPHCGRER
jgi:hypothetical protein